MATALIIVIVISGFIFCHQDIKQRIKLHNFTGQYLYIHAAKCGLYIFIVAVLFHILSVEILLALSFLTPLNFGSNYFLSFSHLLASSGISISEKSMDYSILTILALTTILLPSPVSYVLKRMYMKKYKIRKSNNKWKAQLDLAISKSTALNPFEKLLLDAMIKSEHLMFTLNTGKVYVGMIIDIGTPSETEAAFKDIHISPILSGYRDKDAHTVTFTTEYQKIEKPIKFSVLIKRDTIISVNTFNPEIYAEFNTPKTVPYKMQQRRASI